MSKSRVEDLLEQLVGGPASMALRGAMARMSPQEETTLANALDEALGEMMASMEDIAEVENQRTAETTEEVLELADAPDEALGELMASMEGPAKVQHQRMVEETEEPEVVGALLAPGESRMELGVELGTELAELESGSARRVDAAPKEPEVPAHETGAGDAGVLLQDLLGKLQGLHDARRQRQLELEAALKELQGLQEVHMQRQLELELEQDRSSSAVVHAAVTPTAAGDAAPSAATAAITATYDLVAPVMTTAAAIEAVEPTTEGAEQVVAVGSIAATIEVAQHVEVDPQGTVQAQRDSRLWWRVSGLAAAVLLLLLLAMPTPRDSRAHGPAESVWV